MRGEHECHYLEQGVDDGAHSTILGATAVLRGGGRSREQYFGLRQGGILIFELGKDEIRVKPGVFGSGCIIHLGELALTGGDEAFPRGKGGETVMITLTFPLLMLADSCSTKILQQDRAN